MQTSRRGFVMLAASLAAQVPFLNNPGVAAATKALDQAAAPSRPTPEPEDPPQLRASDRTRVQVPGFSGTFFIKDISIHRDLVDVGSYGFWDRGYLPGLTEVEVVLVSSGPVTISPDAMLMGDPIQLYLPAR